MFAERVRVLIAALWAGSLWTVGYLVAPLLFATLGRTTAGNIAGSVFLVEAWLSVFCAIVLIVTEMSTSKGRNAPERQRLLWLVLGMLGCVLVGYFGLHPFMAALRSAGGAGAAMDAGASARFAVLHGISSLLYLIQSLLAVALVLKAR